MDLDEGIKHLDFHGTVTLAAENVTDLENKRNPVTQCFSNPVILTCILEYLSHSSMKIFSQSCHSILSLIRSNRRFIDKSIFYIGKGKRVDVSMCSSSEDKRDRSVLDLTFLLQNLSFPWTSMRIEADCLDNVGIEIVTNLLSRVVRLELSNCDPRGTGPSNGSDLCRFLVAAQSLKQLVIHASYFQMTIGDRTMFTCNSKVQTILERLDLLYIRSELGKYDSRNDGSLNWAESDTVEALVSMPKYLRSVSLQFDWLKPEVVTEVLTLHKKHANTLTSLTLDRWAWYTDEVLDLVCPNLTELSVLPQGQELPRVCQFIMKQGQLLKLDIDLLFGKTLSLKPLVDTLILRGSELTTFNLAWKLDPPRRGSHIPGPPLDFSWLQQLSKLKNFSIQQIPNIYEDSDTVAPLFHILANLPAGIKTIKCTTGAPDPTCLELEKVEYTQLIIENLGRFRDLTVLNLFQCQDAINDDILLFISSNLAQLRELVFSNCDEITDTGLTAIGSLKSLVKLKFSQCDGIKNAAAIMLSFSFPDLKELRMDVADYFEPVTDWGQAAVDYFKKIISRNRMLEKIEVDEVYRDDLEDVLAKHFGRVIRIEEIDPNEDGLPPGTFERVLRDSYSEGSETSSD